MLTATVLLGTGAAGVAAVALSNGDEGATGENPYPAGGAVPAQRITELDQAVRAAGCEVQPFPDEGRGHTTGAVGYGSNPPTSGPHDPVPAEDGVFADSPPTERLVHSLEHGRVVIQFRLHTRPDLRANLRALFDEDPYHVILTPNATGMPYAVAATAWRHLLGCPRANENTYDALRTFVAEYRDTGPEPVP